MTNGTVWLDKNVDKAGDYMKRGSKYAHKKLNSALDHFDLPAAGKANQYLQTGGVSQAVDMFNTMDGGLMGSRGKTGALAGFEYFTGRDTGSIVDRMGARAGAAAEVSNLPKDLTGKGRGDALETIGKDVRGKLSEMKSAGTGSMRLARAGARTGLLGAGIAAADFLNPFGFGWND